MKTKSKPKRKKKKIGLTESEKKIIREFVEKCGHKKERKEMKNKTLITLLDEIVSTLCYQQDIPMEHKVGMASALHKFKQCFEAPKKIGKKGRR